jgi:mannitol/fructose-specific phosphotransferase system IIA component (Ntr-type)
LLVDALCQAHGLSDRDRILSAVFEREAKMSTAVGQGIAIPHARVESAPGLCAAVAVCPEGLDFPAPDGLPVRLAVLLVSPPSAAGLHVKALAAVGRMGTVRVADLLASRDAAQFLARLRDGEDPGGRLTG